METRTLLITGQDKLTIEALSHRVDMQVSQLRRSSRAHVKQSKASCPSTDKGSLETLYGQCHEAVCWPEHAGYPSKREELDFSLNE